MPLIKLAKDVTVKASFAEVVTSYLRSGPPTTWTPLDVKYPLSRYGTTMVTARGSLWTPHLGGLEEYYPDGCEIEDQQFGKMHQRRVYLRPESIKSEDGRIDWSSTTI